MNRLIACLLALFFSNQACSVDVLTLQESQILRRDHHLYQAWSLARNYYFGTTLKQDQIMALAWQMVYVSLLPASYPDKNNLLAFYQARLSSSQRAEAKYRADRLKEKYGLQEALTEEQLAKAYTVRDEVDAWDKIDLNLPPKQVYAHFNQWLQWLAAQGNTHVALALDEKASQLNQQKKFPIVYGRLVIQGPESIAMVQSNISLMPEGYFVAQALNNTLTFTLPGYQTVSIPVNNVKIQSIGSVVLNKRSHSKRTGVVGRVLPWRGWEQGNMVLVMDEITTVKKPDPWFHPIVPLTVTPAGEFYATGLVPGNYHLYINTAGVTTSIKFTAKEGEIRGLSLIDLRAKSS